MRKVLLVLILAIVGVILLPVVNAAPVSYDYEPTFYDGFGYDCTTGQLIENPIYGATTKMRVNRDDVTIDVGGDYSYVFFWNKYGGYIGYGSDTGTFTTCDKYLGIFGTTITPPDGTAAFAVTVAVGEAEITPGYSFDDVYTNPGYDPIIQGSTTISDAFLNPHEAYIGAYQLDDVFSAPHQAYIGTYQLDDVFTAPAGGTYLDYVIKDAEINPDDLTLTETYVVADVAGISNIGYSRTDMNNYAAEWTSEGWTVLSLTNLIQNGGTLVDTSPANGIADGGSLAAYSDTPSILNNIQYFQSNGTNSRSRFQTTSFQVTTGQNYHLSATVSVVSGYYARLALTVGSALVDKQNGGYTSVVFTSGTTATVGAYIGSITSPADNTLQNDGDVTGISKWAIFNSGSYTKTQIDTALQYTGYLTYNTAYSIPDIAGGNGTFIELDDLETDRAYWVMGSGIGTGLYIFDLGKMADADAIPSTESGKGLYPDVVDWWLWYGYDADRTSAAHETYTCGSYTCLGASYADHSFVGLNPSILADEGIVVSAMSNAEKLYYTNLYYDAFEAVERWEWYDIYGITASNYDDYLLLYIDFLATNYGHWQYYTDYGITESNFSTYLGLHDAYHDGDFDFYQFYTDYGITAANYAYYKDLYADALLESPDRWEWYAWAGVTSEIYDATIDFWPDIAEQAGITDFYADFHDYTFAGSYDSTPETPSNIWDAFADLFTPTIRIIAAIALIGLAVVVLMLKGAPVAVVVVAGIILFIFFVIVEWLPVWWGLLLAAVAFVIFILPLLKGGGTSA